MSRKPRKAEVSVQYVVRDKAEVDTMKVLFEKFLSRCTIYDRAQQRPGEEPEKVPVILSFLPPGEPGRTATDHTLCISLDPACEVAVHDLDEVVSVVYNISEIRVVMKGSKQFVVRCGILTEQ